VFGHRSAAEISAAILAPRTGSREPVGPSPEEIRVAELEGHGFHFAAWDERRWLADVEHRQRRATVEADVASRDRLHTRWQTIRLVRATSTAGEPESQGDFECPRHLEHSRSIWL
jgi:hypothetical protein